MCGESYRPGGRRSTCGAVPADFVFVLASDRGLTSRVSCDALVVLGQGLRVWAQGVETGIGRSVVGKSDASGGGPVGSIPAERGSAGQAMSPCLHVFRGILGISPCIPYLFHVLLEWRRVLDQPENQALASAQPDVYNRTRLDSETG